MRDFTDDLNFEQTFFILRCLLYIINTIFLACGAAVFSIGIYIFYDQSMGDYVGGLEMDFYYNGTAALMVGASIVCLNSFIGICAGFSISRRTLILHVAIIVVTFLILLPASSFLLANGLEQTTLFPHIQVTMKGLINQYEFSMESKTKVDIIQEYIGCCGGNGDVDYREIHLQIPDTCRDHVTGNQYSDSCAEVMSWFMETNTGVICGLSLCICFLQIFGVTIAMFNYQYMKELSKKL